MSRLLCAAALAAVGFLSFAAPTHAADNASPDNSATRNATDTHDAVNEADHAQHHAMVRPWRASETIGLKVEDAQGNKLGKIEDLVFNPKTGHVRYAVLSFGGVVGIGEKYFAVPWNHFRTHERAGLAGSERLVLVLDVNQATLKNAPGFDSKNWPDFGDAAYGNSVDEFYGNTNSAHRSTDA